ncbi:hypothetical protein [Myxosarcina sp. GI1]|uniref:hypothetical protein n=1 Tax=Myxosarcina sp. GI1 TaxID=1541065 RepID=UPI000568449F|nr:hypothetical protein [Myxosarcina sp. GI1]
MSNFLSGVAVLASLLALFSSGFSIIQVLNLQQKLDVAIAELKTTANNSPNLNSTQPNSEPTTPIASPSAATNNAVIQPGQFVRSAFSNLATIELLKANRVPQQSGKVNVQMRIRLTSTGKAAPGLVTKSIYFASTTARDPASGETYSADLDNATPGVNLKVMAINEQPSADAYVWMNIPENVNRVDLYIPDTEAFTSVPIANN